jgi:lipoprotein-anchoring transpeptidase ErfK/SrfK
MSGVEVMKNPVRTWHLTVSAIAVAFLSSTAALAGPLAITSTDNYQSSIFREVMPQQEALPGEDEAPTALSANLRRQTVNYATHEAPGTIVIDTPNTYLYYVLGNGKAVRYGIGVGREGFTWNGTQSVARKTEWPDWHPPAEMIARQPYLPRFMAGGPGNPLGARAMYLGNSLYRIHGTNAPETIGTKVSSGCIRLINADVIDLFNRVTVGTKVVVMPDGPRTAPSNVARASQEDAMNARAQVQQQPTYEPAYARPVAEAPAPFFLPPPPWLAPSRIY